MNLLEVLKKKEFDLEYVKSILNQYEENYPVKPDGEDYNLFNQLFELNLVIKETVPIWRNSTLLGSEITFVYNMDLDYSHLLFHSSGKYNLTNKYGK